MDGREELNQEDGDKSLISYPQTKKTDIVEMYNFVKNNKEIDWEKFQKWLNLWRIAVRSIEVKPFIREVTHP